MKIACTGNIPIASYVGLNEESRQKFMEMIKEGLIERKCLEFKVTDKGTQFLRNICSLFDEYYRPLNNEQVFSKGV